MFNVCFGIVVVLAFDVPASIGRLEKGQKVQRSIAAFLDNERGSGWVTGLAFCFWDLTTTHET
jgi:hypothetical protein